MEKSPRSRSEGKPVGSKGTSSLRRRLSRLGDKRRDDSPPPAPGLAQARTLPAGSEVETPFGAAFRLERRLPLDHRHGEGLLSDLLSLEGELIAGLARRGGFDLPALHQLVFLDTETTGLAGGTGTLVFLVGVGSFSQEGFILRQYFLRDPSEEASMLHALRQDIGAASGFVTFNGQVFDLPLLETRYVLGLSQRWALTRLPNLDLLPPARRLWRRSFPDCTLATLERRVLGVIRTEEDVPGERIPGIYLDYLRRGEVSQIHRVLYHNAEDVLSLVGLAASVLAAHHETRLGGLSSGEALAVARWHEAGGRFEKAEAAYRRALAHAGDSLQREGIILYSRFLKARGRRAEAATLWREWHTLLPSDPEPCIELAKLHEWHTADLVAAMEWAIEANRCLDDWQEGWQRDEAQAQIAHRIERIARKLGGQAAPAMASSR